MESNDNRNFRLEFSEWKWCQVEMKIFIDNILLVISMNSSLPSIQYIHDHMKNYVKLPENWHTKIVSEFVENIYHVVLQNIMNDNHDAHQLWMK